MTTITNGYCTLGDFAEHMLSDQPIQPGHENNAARAINTASRWIDGYCGRRFTTDANASARIYRAPNAYCVKVDDFYTSSGLVVATDPGDTGTFSQTWAAADYELGPINGVGVGGLAWPYSEILSVSGRAWPQGLRSSIQVTAKWGWAAVPDAVAQACLLMAAYVYKSKDAPFGATGFADLGIISARLPSGVKDLLALYRREDSPGGPMVG